MAISAEQLLQPPVIMNAISRIRTPMTRFQDFYGLGFNGANTVDVPGKAIAVDLFDNVRDIAMGRAPGSGPASVSPVPVGQFTANLYRAHEKVPLLMERIYSARAIGGSYGDVDTGGVKYITRQQNQVALRFKNNREFMISRMLRGSGFMVKMEGENNIPVDSSGHFTVSPQVPAGNLTTVGGIFAGNWQTAASGLPHDEIAKLNAYSEAQSGYTIAHAWMNTVTWTKMIKTTQVAALAGTANTPFSEYRHAPGNEGMVDTGFTAVLRGIPWLTIHIVDSGTNVTGTFTTFVEDNKVMFTPEPGEWLLMYQGTEWVQENVMDSGASRTGFYAWATRDIDPARYDLKAVDICMPVLTIPKAIFYATVAA